MSGGGSGVPDDEAADGTAAGWDAIDAALRPLYGDQAPAHVGFGPTPALGGADLQGASAYARDDHWHYVSYGLSDLFDAGSDNPAQDPDGTPLSGWGFELTLRVARGPEETAPTWPFLVLNHLATYVQRKGVPLSAGERFDMQDAATGYPRIPGAPPTGLTVWAFAPG